MGKLGELLREARERRGISQRALARRSGIAQPAISRIERGEESPSFERFAYLLSCLGLRPTVRLEPMPYRGDPEHLAVERQRTPGERLAGAFNAAILARELRTGVERARR